MENLFQLEKAKINYLDQMRCTKVTADYHRYFIDLLLPTIIEDSINNLNLVNIRNIVASGHNIPINCKINFVELEDDQSNPYIKKGKDSYILYISNNKYNKLIDKFFSFFIKNNISCCLYMSDDSRIIPIEIKTDAITLVKAIEKERKSYKGPIDPTLETKKPLELANKQISYLSTIFADKICEELFEKEFLDKLIVSTYKEGLGLIDYRLKDSLKSSTTKVTRSMRIGPKKDNNLIVSDEYLDPLTLLIEDFVKRYNLGIVERYAYSNIVSINTELNNLRDAYYMEKQRIEQSFTQEAYQYQTRHI